MEPNAVRFSIKLDGEKLQDGEVHLRDLELMLESVRELFSEANKELGGRELEIISKPPKGGSLVLDLLLQYVSELPALLEQTPALLERVIESPEELLDAVRKLIRIVKVFEGQRVREDDAEFKQPELTLYRSPSMRQKLRTFVRRAFNRIPADEMTFDQEKVCKEDVPLFEALEQAETSRKHLGERRYKINSLSFSPTSKWSLEKEGTVWVRIKDQDFLDDVKRNIRRFSKDDTIICELYEVEANDGTLEWEIDNVRHEPANELPQPQKLPL